MELTKKEKSFQLLKRSAAPLLWEYETKNLADSQLRELIMERVMQYGSMKQIQLMLKVFSFNDLARFFADKGWKNFSNIDFNFWFYILKDYNKKDINWDQLLHQRQSVRSKFIAWKY
jgi:hypothetical protein